MIERHPICPYNVEDASLASLRRFTRADATPADAADVTAHVTRFEKLNGVLKTPKAMELLGADSVKEVLHEVAEAQARERYLMDLVSRLRAERDEELERAAVGRRSPGAAAAERLDAAAQAPDAEPAGASAKDPVSLSLSPRLSLSPPSLRAGRDVMQCDAM